MKFVNDNEHAARQLAARHFPLVSVTILADQVQGKECASLVLTSDNGHLANVKSDQVLFRGLGQDAGPLDQPLAWTSTPVWKKGLWLRRVQITGADAVTNVLEWDGLDETPDVVMATAFAERVEWLGPLPALNF